MRRVKISELEVGMVLAKPVYGKLDLIFAHTGDKMTKYLIEGFQRLGKTHVTISEAYDDKDLLRVRSKSVKECMKDYYQLIIKMRNVFESEGEVDTSIFEECREPLIHLINEVSMETSLVMSFMRLGIKESFIYQHLIRVALLGSIFARWMNLSEEEIRDITWVGLLHDIGNIKIPDVILKKPDMLNDSEFEQVRNHTKYGYEIAMGISFLDKNVARGVREHHERVNGTGYPDKLKGSGIHLYAKIIAVADTFDALASQTLYKDKVSPFETVEEISKCQVNNELDPDVVDAFNKNVYKLFIGDEVVLDDGRKGEILKFNSDNPKRPVIRVDGQIVDLSRAMTHNIVTIR